MSPRPIPRQIIPGARRLRALPAAVCGLLFAAQVGAASPPLGVVADVGQNATHVAAPVTQPAAGAVKSVAPAAAPTSKTAAPVQVTAPVQDPPKKDPPKKDPPVQVPPVQVPPVQVPTVQVPPKKDPPVQAAPPVQVPTVQVPPVQVPPVQVAAPVQVPTVQDPLVKAPPAPVPPTVPVTAPAPQQVEVAPVPVPPVQVSTVQVPTVQVPPVQVAAPVQAAPPVQVVPPVQAVPVQVRSVPVPVAEAPPAAGTMAPATQQAVPIAAPAPPVAPATDSAGTVPSIAAAPADKPPEPAPGMTDADATGAATAGDGAVTVSAPINRAERGLIAAAIPSAIGQTGNTTGGDELVLEAQEAPITVAGPVCAGGPLIDAPAGVLAGAPCPSADRVGGPSSAPLSGIAAGNTQQAVPPAPQASAGANGIAGGLIGLRDEATTGIATFTRAARDVLASLPQTGVGHWARRNPIASLPLALGALLTVMGILLRQRGAGRRVRVRASS